MPTAHVPCPCVQCQRRIPDARVLTRHTAVHVPAASVPHATVLMPAHLRPYVPMKLRESALIPFCNVPPPRVRARLHLAALEDINCPHRPTPIFSAHFVLTRAHPEITFRSVTHPQNFPGHARLTSEFFRDRLLKKKLQLIGMSIPTHPRCPCTDPPRARSHVGGICAPTRPCSCLRTYARTCP